MHSHLDKLGLAHLVLDGGVVRVGVEHDEREREQIGRVGIGEHVRVAGAVVRREPLHHAVDLLRLARQPQPPCSTSTSEQGCVRECNYECN